jgi:DNA repair ATPase RecN
MGSEAFYPTFTSTLPETPITHLADLENAYESLLSTRSNPLFSTESQIEVSEDDALCNRNLQTAHLFKTYNSMYVALNDKIQVIINDCKVLEESITKFTTGSANFKGVCKVYCETPIDVYRNLDAEISKEYLRLQNLMKKKMEEDRAKLEAELDAVSMKLNGVRKLIQTGIEDLIKPEDISKKMCTVCYEQEVCMVMVPCGHTYCDACSKYDYRAKCPQCRATINSRVKMFFSI